MSNLQSFSLLNSCVNKIHSEEGTETVGQAFMRLALSTILSLNDEEIEDALTDGPHDEEIDAIYIQGKTIHIFTFKYTDDFKNTKKNYPQTELDTFVLTLDAIISGDLDKGSVNNAVWDKYVEIVRLAANGSIEFKVYVASNKLEPTNTGKRKLDKLFDKFRLPNKPHYFDQEKLVDKIFENNTKKLDGSLTFVGYQHFPKSDGNIRTVVGVIPALQLIDLIKLKDEKGNAVKDDEGKETIDDNAFNENIRVYKKEHRINKAIIKSAKSDDNFEFFYLNNGITIICEHFDYTPNKRDPFVPLTNFQIINGGQTSHSLFEVHTSEDAEEREKLKYVELLVRVCLADKNNPIRSKISETSNNQIPVSSRDLHSLDLIQRKIKEEFKTLGYFYEAKPNEFNNIEKSLVLNNELLGQLYMSYHLGMPSEAKNIKSKVFGDEYESIFNEEITTANELLKLYNLFSPILAKKKLIQINKRKSLAVAPKEEFISWGTFHILFSLKFLFEKELALIDEKSISRKEKLKEKEAIFLQKREEFTNKAIEQIFKVIEEQRRIDKEFSYDKFFKETTTNLIIKNHFESYLKE